MRIYQLPSPHYDERKAPISMIVLHATHSKTLTKTLDRFFLCRAPNRISTHYLITRKGIIFQMVPDDKRAWHAGVARWGQITEDINSHSIGIEFQCAGKNGVFEPFTKAQINAGLDLCRQLMERYHISPENVVGHEHIAPERKTDPGTGFPWHLFVRQHLASPARLFFMTENGFHKERES